VFSLNSKWQYPEELDHFTFNKEHQKKVLDEIDQMSKVKSRKPKRIFPLIVAFAGVFLIVNILFFQEDIQRVLAKIPYVSQFIEQEEDRSERMGRMLIEIDNLLDKKDVKTPNWDYQFNTVNKVFTIEVKGWAGKDDEIKEPILQSMEKNGFSNYKLSIKPYQENKGDTPIKDESIKQYMRDSEALKESLTKHLKQENFELMFPVTIQINPTQGVYINAIVPKTETRLDLLEKIMKEEGQQFGENPEIDIRQVEKKAREQEVRWEETGAVHQIARAMMESDSYPVTGFSYSFHPYPLQVIIKTSLNHKDSDAKIIADEIRSEIKLYIETGKGTESIRGDEYEVRVLGKDKKEIE
jgi:hypothetical protein